MYAHRSGVTSVARIPKQHTFYSKAAAYIIQGACATPVHFRTFEGNSSQEREFFIDENFSQTVFPQNKSVKII
jgi:hypothetical protein